MKTELRFNRLFVSLMVLGSSLGFVACDDENTPEPPVEITTQVMYGDYNGKMLALAAAPKGMEAEEEGGEAPVGVDVSAKVDKDTVYFEGFPIKDIVLSIVKDEEMADKIVEAVGDVKYKVGYEPTLTSDKDSVTFVLDPKPLTLSVSIPSEVEGEEASLLKIEVEVSSEKGASYDVKETNLKFKINLEKVLLGEGEEQVDLPNFLPTTLQFEMKKSQK